MADYSVSVKVKGDASSFEKTMAKTKATLSGLGNSLSGFGSKLNSIGTSLTNKITKPALIATGALAGIVAVKGFDRLVGIDSAQAKLKALGHDAKSVEDIMVSALDAVKGTAYGLDEAATAAATAVAAGVKPGKDLTKYLTMVGDAAAIAGYSMSDMGSILGKVQTAQRAYTMEIQQLADAGLPIYQWLAEELDTTADGVRELASTGQISSEQFFSAIEKNIGGAAKIIGEESFTGALSNIGASISRIGANFLDAGGKGGGFFSTLKPMMADFNERLGSVEDKAAELGVKFGEAFQKAITKIQELKDKFNELDPATQGLILKAAGIGAAIAVGIGPALTVLGSIATFVGTIVIPAISKVAGVFGTLGGAIAKAGGVVPLLTSKLASIGAVVAGPIGLVIGIIAAVVTTLIHAWKTSDSFRAAVANLGSALKNAFIQVLPVFKQLGQIFSQIVEAVAPLVTMLMDSLVPVLTTIVNFIANLISVLMPPIVAIVQAIMNVIQAVIPVIATIIGFIATAISIVISIITPIISFIAMVITTIISIIAPIVTFIANIISVVASVIGTIIGVVANVFGTVYSIVSGIFTTISTFISNIIDGISRIIATVSETVSRVFNAIREKITSIMTAVGEKISSVFEGVKSKWEDLKSFAAGVADNIRGAFDTVVGKIKSVVNAVIRGINKAIGVINSIAGIVGVEISTIPYLKHGTDNWQGGFAYMNEGGRGELTYLPNGAQVIPHDISVKYAKEAAKQNVSGDIDGDNLAQNIAAAVMGLSPALKEGMKEAMNGTQMVVDRREFGRLVES